MNSDQIFSFPCKNFMFIILVEEQAFKPVFWIGIRGICNILGLSDPDPK
jgi:hypothetical protein